MILNNYTDTEIKAILKTMVILCDTREQKNQHIKQFFDTEKRRYQDKTLSTGDYTAVIPANKDMGIYKPLYFDKSIVIERKGSLEELSGNFTRGRERFKRELTRANADNMEFHLMIEGSSFTDIINHNYKTELNENAFLGTLLSLQCEYGFNLMFVQAADAGLYIERLLYYHVRKTLLNGGL